MNNSFRIDLKEIEMDFKSRDYFLIKPNEIFYTKEDNNYNQSWYNYYDMKINKIKIPICSIDDLYLFLSE